MKIGIDAYPLYEPNNTGIGTYVLNLLTDLSKIDHVNTYLLYTPGVIHREKADMITKNPNFKIITAGGILKKSRRLWLQSLSLIRVIRRNNPDVFFGGGEYIPLLMPLKTVAVMGLPDIVFRLFPDTVPPVNMIFYKTLFRLCLMRADRIITISETSKKEIIDNLGIRKEITAIPLGINNSEFTPKENTAKKDYILFVGTLQPRKNLINLIKAYSSIHERIKERLVIVGGSGWLNSGLADTVRNLPDKVKDSIEFKGYVTQAELVNLYREARLFVLPSLHEGFGLIILEAMASGTPVVTSMRGAIPEFFSGAAEFADPLSPDDIACAIERVLSDKKRQDELIARGLERAAILDSARVAKGYLDVWEKIAAGLKK
jgi:glycosyltransferase involved in cell wall biosynthesis